MVRASAVYLMVGQHLPVARTAALLAQVCGAPVSTGWLAGLPGEAAAGLAPFLDELRAQLVAEDVLHADETGLADIRRPLLVPRRLQRPAHPARLPPEKGYRGASRTWRVLPFF